jgi:hypothetical protein
LLDGGVHEPPLATYWQLAEPLYVCVSSAPQQLSPAGQSHEYRQWKGEALPVHPASVPATHCPVGVGRAGVTQHVLVSRSHSAVPLHADEV